VPVLRVNPADAGSAARSAITHGILAERAEWRAFVESLGVPCELLHRDQFRDRFPSVAVPLPAVFRLVDGEPRVRAEAAALAACSGLADLETLLCRNSTGSPGPDD
jgi:hypothetical protein